MDHLPITKFKATCLSVMDRVRRTGRPVRVTRFGRPVADVVPSAPLPPPRRVLGALADRTVIHGDIVAPAAALEEWESLR